MDRLDENDAVFGEIEKHVESCCYSHLRALEEAIEYAELQEHLRTLEEDDSASGVTVPDGSSTAGKSARLEAAQVKKMNKEIARHVKKKRREATLAKRAAEWGASRARTERAEEALSSWNAGISEDDEPSGPSVWLKRWEQQNQEFIGCGYHAKISEYMERRYDQSHMQSPKARASVNAGTSAQKRMERRLLKEAMTKGGEELYLALGAFDASEKQVCSSSVVVDKQVYTIVDSGSTVNIEDLTADTVVEDFDASAYAKITAYNGTTSKSNGSGTIIGYMTSIDGEQISIRVPKVHDVRGAGNALMSVSVMVSAGYEFHFTKTESYLLTPEKAKVALEAKGGLYWLKWNRAIGPGSSPGKQSIRRFPPKLEDARWPTVAQDYDYKTFFGDGVMCMPVDNAEEQPCIQKDCERCNGATRPRTQAISLQLAHRRLAHFNQETIKKMVKAQAINCTLSDSKACDCEVCRVSKAKRKHVPTEREQPRDEDLEPFSRVWTDVKGKVRPKDHWGNQYIVTFTCEKTRWVYVDFARKKSDIKEAYKTFLEWVKLRGYAVRLLQSDNGGEYTSNEISKVISEFQKISVEYGVTQNFTCAYTPEQNGVAERLNRTLVELARSLLVEAGMSEAFWSLAVKHVVYCRNRIWHKVHQTSANVGASAYQVLYGKPPNIDHLRVWGCDAYKLDMRPKESTFQRKATKMIYVGTSSNRKGWVLFDPKSRKLSTTFHVSFNEDMANRRCALRDFDLRQGNKAGRGATREEEREALMERSLYEQHPQVLFEDVDDKPVPLSAEVPPAGEIADEQGVSPPAETPFDKEDADAPLETDREDAEEAYWPEEAGERPKDEARGRGNRAPVDSTRRTVPGGERNAGKFNVPARRAVIGAKQDLDDEDYEFLKTAMKHNLPCVMQQRNPKIKGSRARYEQYKGGKTLREIKRMGASWADITWDYARGFIDFGPTAASSAALAELVEGNVITPIANSPGSYVDDDGNVLTNGQFCSGAFTESVQQDYAVAAVEHIESMSHRAQELLKKALGEQTLVQFAHCCASRVVIPEPLSVKEAMESEHAAEWRQAMQEEIDTLTKFQCFEVVPRAEALKHGRLVKSKWVFKVKYEADGSLQRFKARLVAKGFTQVPGSDFYETYSPVFSYTSFRTLLALAAEKDMALTGWDLKSSFIQQKLDVDHMYMETPFMFDKFTSEGAPAALHCLQSIYGLKQSSRLLHERIVKFMKKLGFKQLISDQCVFVRGEGEDQVIVATWVDDIIMASKRGNESDRLEFDRAIREEFEMSPWTDGEADWILNMKIVRDWEQGTLHLSQPAAIEKLAERFGLTGREGRAPHVPISPTVKLKKTAEKDIVPASVFDYQSAVGGLLYLALTARPDIAYAVGVLSRFMACPGKEHIDVAKQTIKYLYGTKDWGITYTRGIGGSPHLAEKATGPRMAAFIHSRKSDAAADDANGDSRIMGTYCDADLAGDDGTRKSTTGYCMVLNGGVICWSSKLQSTVALSTAEAETNAGVEAVKQLVHLRLFLRELGHEQEDPSTVYEDNVAAISLAHGKEQSKRAKHYQIKVHFLNEQFKRGVFEYMKIGTKGQLGDVWTKGLPREDFCRFRGWMGVRPATATGEVRPRCQNE